MIFIAHVRLSFGIDISSESGSGSDNEHPSTSHGHLDKNSFSQSVCSANAANDLPGTSREASGSSTMLKDQAVAYSDSNSNSESSNSYSSDDDSENDNDNEYQPSIHTVQKTETSTDAVESNCNDASKSQCTDSNNVDSIIDKESPAVATSTDSQQSEPSVTLLSSDQIIKSSTNSQQTSEEVLVKFS